MILSVVEKDIEAVWVAITREAPKQALEPLYGIGRLLSW